MGTPYIGEIRMFAGNFAPLGWAFCNGAIMSIAENDTLFNLIGTTYGGDGQNTFALPDLQGRIPRHYGQGSGLSNIIIGQTGGTETVTITQNQMPAHTHFVSYMPAAQTISTPTNSTFLAKTPSNVLYTEGVSATSKLSLETIGYAGGSQPINILMPYCCVNYIISLFGIYPSQG